MLGVSRDSLQYRSHEWYDRHAIQLSVNIPVIFTEFCPVLCDGGCSKEGRCWGFYGQETMVNRRIPTCPSSTHRAGTFCNFTFHLTSVVEVIGPIMSISLLFLGCTHDMIQECRTNSRGGKVSHEIRFTTVFIIKFILISKQTVPSSNSNWDLFSVVGQPDEEHAFTKKIGFDGSSQQ